MTHPADIFGGFLDFFEEMLKHNCWPVMQQSWRDRKLESRVTTPWKAEEKSGDLLSKTETASKPRPFRPGGSSGRGRDDPPAVCTTEESETQSEQHSNQPIPKRVFRPGGKRDSK